MALTLIIIIIMIGTSNFLTTYVSYCRVVVRKNGYILLKRYISYDFFVIIGFISRFISVTHVTQYNILNLKINIRVKDFLNVISSIKLFIGFWRKINCSFEINLFLP